MRCFISFRAVYFNVEFGLTPSTFVTVFSASNRPITMIKTFPSSRDYCLEKTNEEVLNEGAWRQVGGLETRLICRVQA